MTRAARLLAIVAIAGGLAGASAILRARETDYPAPPPTARLLYLTSGKTAARAMLSFRALGADIYWIRAIQSFGRDRRNLTLPDRFALLQPLLDVTTSLDPHFNIAYRFGAIYLSLDQAGGTGTTRPGDRVAREGTRKQSRPLAVRVRHRVRQLLVHEVTFKRPRTGSAGPPRCPGRRSGFSRFRR